MMRSGNPALKGSVFSSASRAQDESNAMTVRGTMNKTFILMVLALLSAAWVWGNVRQLTGLIMPALIIGFILAMVTIFKKEWAGITAPVYALVEGVVIGGISAIFEMSYPGIVIQAVTLTFGVLFCMLVIYKSGIIKVTDKFRMGVAAATGAIALIYIISIVMSFFGARMPFIHESGPLGIGFSLVVVGIAALNLVLDFDFIEKGSEYGVPKYMEWFGAFALIVTLIWLYLELLRLLSKIRSR